MHVILCSLIGYLFGNINAAYIISKLQGFDIRDRGSGNAGASNVIITIGKKAGLITAIFDITKAAVASTVAVALFPRLRYAHILGGSACIIGHIFPILMRFHGGKGLACLGGMILSYNPEIFLLLLAIEIFLGFGLDYICVVPITGSIIFTGIYAFLTGDAVGTMILASVSLIILYKHIENLRRILIGTEAHISFLWKKDQEIERIKHNTN
ncbi:MAG: glycerol-3-phosphate acyltransferase [Ruminococcus sp.]|nr:glycerol-3-phosphate acyltransferase [Ruminococcus sp.]